MFLILFTEDGMNADIISTRRDISIDISIRLGETGFYNGFMIPDFSPPLSWGKLPHCHACVNQGYGLHGDLPWLLIFRTHPWQEKQILVVHGKNSNYETHWMKVRLRSSSNFVLHTHSSTAPVYWLETVNFKCYNIRVFVYDSLIDFYTC